MRADQAATGFARSGERLGSVALEDSRQKGRKAYGCHSRISTPVVEIRTSNSAGSVTGTNGAEPYSASNSVARKVQRRRRLKRSIGLYVPRARTVRGDTYSSFGE